MALLSHRRVTLNPFSSAKKYFEKEVWGILENVGLADQANVLGDSISHGDKKRLELAITLGTEPELLLLDEPTCGMSPEETESTMLLVRQLSEERGLTILFTEHDMSVVFGIAKRISVQRAAALARVGAIVEEPRWVRERANIPIIADEACLRPSDIPGLAGVYDGVNIKLDKAGGILQGYRMIQIARALGLKTMLGCMISSSVSVTAAAQLSPLVDYADLDGNLLIGNDPYIGATVRAGKLVLPTGPGLGLSPI